MTAAKFAGAIAGAAAAVLAFPLSASASGVQLSLSQTLALYGTRLNSVYYNANTSEYSNIHFDFIGDTYSWQNQEWIDAGHKIAIQALYYGLNNGINDLPHWRDTAPALIYACNFDPVVSDSNSFAEVELTPAFTIPDIKHFQQYIYYSGDVDPDYVGTGGGGGTASNVWCENICGTPLGRVKCNALSNNAYHVWERFLTYGSWLGWDMNSTSSTLNGAYVPLYGIYNNAVSNSVFQFDGQTIHLNSMRSVEHGPFNEKTCYLLVGCPRIDGEYAGPTIPATVTTPVTTRPQYTAETVTTPVTGVTIDNFQDDIQEIIRNQRWQLYNQEIMIRNQMVQNENLRLILNRLDDIYNKMNIDTQNPLNTDGSMWQEFAGALTGMTSHTMPNYVLQGLSFWADCSQEILTRYDFLVPLGAFALTMLVIYYVLFKGRTS